MRIEAWHQVVPGLVHAGSPSCFTSHWFDKVYNKPKRVFGNRQGRLWDELKGMNCRTHVAGCCWEMGQAVDSPEDDAHAPEDAEPSEAASNGQLGPSVVADGV